MALPTSVSHREELLASARQLIQLDLAAALRWASAMSPGEDRELVAGTILDELARTDPRGAIEVAEALGAGMSDGRLEHLAQFWAEENPRDATAWVQQAAPTPNRDRLVARIALVVAQRDPMGATALVKQGIRAAPERTGALLAVIRRWGQRDPDAATRHVSTWADTALRVQGLHEIEVSRRQRAAN
jgi:hypothetical protein